MKQLAAIMMFAAWLLYGAMPAVAVVPVGGQPGHAMSERPMIEHSGHGAAVSEAVHSDHAHGDTQQPCPHAGKGGNTICVAPFCSACLVVLPDVAFADTGRFIHRYPAPETGPALIVSGPAPLTPPPRA